jgi:hypothetical protein
VKKPRREVRWMSSTAITSWANRNVNGSVDVNRTHLFLRKEAE